ncbi:MAG: FxLYD domain-containing protein [Alicyclobacillus sp.]|nr:FxLYD domain-containing protein [Alicyclobacillus sp.]
MDGIATNHDKTKHSAFLIVSFFDSNGKLLGTGNGAIDSLEPGQDIAFQTLSQVPFSSVATFKVQVQSLM